MECQRCPKCGTKMIKIKEIVSKGIIKIRKITCQCPKCGYKTEITIHDN